MKEELLHFVWRCRHFDVRNLQTTTGERIQIIEFGRYNRDAGPDFLHAKLRIGDTVWAGNIEMHLYTSDWERHGHSEDPAYDNVILHVVLKEDRVIYRPGGERLICLELQQHLLPGLLGRYEVLVQTQSWVPCGPQLPSVPEPLWGLWLERMAVERLETYTERLQGLLRENLGNWKETFYQWLARGLGLPANGQPFFDLACRTPMALLRREQSSLLSVEALLFGQAGFLIGPFREPYPVNLKQRYDFFRKKYRLEPMPVVVWKFMRMRPADFPTLRIAQLAAVIYERSFLFSRCMQGKTIQELMEVFEVHTSEYWSRHYHFARAAKRVRERSLGQSIIRRLLINVIIPFQFFYAQTHQRSNDREQALELLAKLPAENNHLIRGWKKLDVASGNARHTQALLHLKRNYCDARRCLDCQIGSYLLGRRASDPKAFVTPTKTHRIENSRQDVLDIDNTQT